LCLKKVKIQYNNIYGGAAFDTKIGALIGSVVPGARMGEMIFG